jgi:hypothetical protein
VNISKYIIEHHMYTIEHHNKTYMKIEKEKEKKINREKLKRTSHSHYLKNLKISHDIPRGKQPEIHHITSHVYYINITKFIYRTSHVYYVNIITYIIEHHIYTT